MITDSTNFSVFCLNSLATTSFRPAAADPHGSCATDCTQLNLRNRGITTLANAPFAGMDALQLVYLDGNAISALRGRV